MTLDEAIEHAKEVASTCDDSQCAADHIQLAEWLRRARGADEAARWYMSKIQNLQAENAKLREYLIMACEVIDAAVAGGYNAADSSVKKMHATLKDLGIEVDE